MHTLSNPNPRFLIRLVSKDSKSHRNAGRRFMLLPFFFAPHARYTPETPPYHGIGIAHRAHLTRKPVYRDCSPLSRNGHPRTALVNARARTAAKTLLRKN